MSREARFAQSLIVSGMRDLIFVALFASPRERLVREDEVEEVSCLRSSFTEMARNVGTMFGSTGGMMKLFDMFDSRKRCWREFGKASGYIGSRIFC